jgi:single-strand DNA-binding protein
MAANNNVQLVGYVGRDAEMRYTGKGTEITNFSINVREHIGKDENGKSKYKDNWFDITAWGALAKTASKLAKKGATLAVACHLKKNKYEKNGQTIYANNLILDELNVVVWPANGSSNGGHSQQESDSDSAGVEEFPF